MDKNLFRLECVRIAAELPLVSSSNLGDASILLLQAKRLFEWIYNPSDAEAMVTVSVEGETAH